MAARSRACFCLAKAREPNAPVALQSAAHLRGLKLSELKARALEAGVDGTALDDALDSPNPRAAVAALVAAATDDDQVAARRKSLDDGTSLLCSR